MAGSGYTNMADSNRCHAKHRFINNDVTSDRENMASQVEPRRAYDLLFKLMLVGDSGVGKTCVMVRYTDDSFATTFISTIGMGGMER